MLFAFTGLSNYRSILLVENVPAKAPIKVNSLCELVGNSMLKDGLEMDVLKARDNTQ